MSKEHVVPALEDSHAWSAIHAGMRPSNMLALGAVLTSVGPILYLWTSPLLAWAVWGAALATCSAGMIMCGLRPWFSHLGVAAGLVYLAQFSALAAVVAGVHDAALAYRMLAVPKLLILVVIAVQTRKHVARHRRWLLGAAGILGTLKIAARLLDLIPTQANDAVDAAANTLVAVALFVLAIGLRRRENEWAHQVHELSSSNFDDFNLR